MQAHKDTSIPAAQRRHDKLDILLRQEESKLLELLTAVSKKTSNDVVEPKMHSKEKNRTNDLFSNNSNRKNDRLNSVRPQITQSYREAHYSKNVINELQALLDQTMIDMQKMKDDRDRDMEILQQRIKTLETDVEVITERGSAIAHYSNLFVAATTAALEKGNLTATNSTKMFLDKLSETLISIIKSSELLADGDLIASSTKAVKNPNRRQSINMVPFDRNNFRIEEYHSEDEINNTENENRTPFSSLPTSHEFIQLPDSSEGTIEILFMEFSWLIHSRLNSQSEDEISKKFLDGTYMSKRNFLSMCFVLDILDSRLTLLAAKSCFEKFAFLSERGQRKFNNRLDINAFVECICLMSEFKYTDDDNESERIRKFLDYADLSGILSDRRRLQILFDTFYDLCHPGLFDVMAENQMLLSKVYKRSANYGINSTITAVSSPVNKTDMPVSATVIQGFKIFCVNYKIVPLLTRESVVTRISMYMSSLSPDGFRFFMGCLLNLCVALCRTDEGNSNQFPTTATFLAVFERIILQIQTHM